MAYVDFAEIKKSVSMVQVLAWLDIKLKPSGDQLRGSCPYCEGAERGFAVTPAKNLFNAFCGCGKGTVIDLVALHFKCSAKEAAQKLQAQFLRGNSRTVSASAEHSSPPTTRSEQKDGDLKPLDYLETDHDIVPALGLTPEVCQALGWGYAAKGTMRGRFLIALRRDDGKLVGYLGIATKEEMIPLLHFPKNLPQMLEQPVEPKKEGDAKFAFLRVVK